MRPCNSLVVLIASLALVSAVQAGTQTVYRSVSPDGTVSFSDTPPADAQASTLDIAFSSSTPQTGDIERLRAMRETTDRLVADRLARERHRADLKKLRAETAAARRSAQPVSVSVEQRDIYYRYPRPLVYRNTHSVPRLRATTSTRQPSLSEQLRRRTSTSQVYAER